MKSLKAKKPWWHVTPSGGNPLIHRSEDDASVVMRRIALGISAGGK